MDGHVPAVSVSMITYNHERYIAEAIHSVLEQTHSDLELVVVDDGSADRTWEIISSFNDPRIVAIHQDNRGPGAAGNRALAACRGKYVAMMSGDDVSCRDRIERQLAAYGRSGPGLLFAGVTFIGENGEPVPAGHYCEGVFDVSARSREEIYHRFFFRGNFLNAITLFTERTLLGAAPNDPLLYQLQDFDMWVRFLKQHGLSVLPEPVVRYRIRPGQQNLSSPCPEHMVRSNNEYLIIMRRFFDGAPLDLFRKAFARDLRFPDCSAPEEVACEQALLFLKAPHPMQWVVGMERLYDLLAARETARVLRDRYQFSSHDFVDLLKQFDILNLWPRATSTLFVDTGRGFNEVEVCRQPVFLARSTFALTFDASRFSAIRALRWDPVELHHCSVELRQITWKDKAGQVHSLDPATVSSNGSSDRCGTHRFETDDPIFFLPVQGEMASITLEGRWNIQDVYSTARRTAVLHRDARDEIRARDDYIRTLTEGIRARDEQIRTLDGQLKDILHSRRWHWFSRACSLVERMRTPWKRRQAG
jgi:glycosyltransferase involved in cell wall biosynthesis